MRLSQLSALQQITWNPDGRELRRFAAAMVVGFGVAGSVVTLRTGTVWWLPVSLWTAGLVLAACSFVPILGRYVYLAVYVVSGLIGAVVSRVLLALIFALVFVPVGLALRLSGQDPLNRRPNGSTWRTLEDPKDPASYYRQF